MAKEIKFDLLWAILFGIGGYLVFTLLNSTAIFAVIPNLAEIGLFLGFVVGGFRDKLDGVFF